jgi:hypothetical protein
MPNSGAKRLSTTLRISENETALLHTLITSALNGSVRSASLSDLFNYEEVAVSHYLGVWTSLRVYLGAVEKK